MGHRRATWERDHSRSHNHNHSNHYAPGLRTARPFSLVRELDTKLTPGLVSLLQTAVDQLPKQARSNQSSAQALLRGANDLPHSVTVMRTADMRQHGRAVPSDKEAFMIDMRQSVSTASQPLETALGRCGFFGGRNALTTVGLALPETAQNIIEVERQTALGLIQAENPEAMKISYYHLTLGQFALGEEWKYYLKASVNELAREVGSITLQPLRADRTDQR